MSIEAKETSETITSFHGTHIVTMDGKNRITIPKEIRDSCNLGSGSILYLICGIDKISITIEKPIDKNMLFLEAIVDATGRVLLGRNVIDMLHLPNKESTKLYLIGRDFQLIICTEDKFRELLIISDATIASAIGLLEK